MQTPLCSGIWMSDSEYWRNISGTLDPTFKTGDVMSGVSGSIARPRDRIGDFKYGRECIFEVIDRMLDLGVSARDSCLEMKEKLDADSFNLVVVGQFKHVKTCLIDALLGDNILPVSFVP